MSAFYTTLTNYSAAPAVAVAVAVATQMTQYLKYNGNHDKNAGVQPYKT